MGLEDEKKEQWVGGHIGEYTQKLMLSKLLLL